MERVVRECIISGAEIGQACGWPQHVGEKGKSATIRAGCRACRQVLRKNRRRGDPGGGMSDTQESRLRRRSDPGTGRGGAGFERVDGRSLFKRQADIVEPFQKAVLLELI